VVDGLQRLTALNRFCVTHQLRLRGLEFLSQFEEFSYEELPRGYQRRIQETQVTIFLIEQGTPPEVKFNIFKRINTGGLPLSAQEIRHALNQGPAAELIRELAMSEVFRRATDNGIRDDRMADRECVLRYLAFTLHPPTEYRTRDLDGFLNEAMGELGQMTQVRLRELAEQFYRAVDLAYHIFGSRAFRKQYPDVPRVCPINKALFETWSVNLAKLEDREACLLCERKGAVVRKFQELMLDAKFQDTISQGTGEVLKVGERFARIAKLISDVLR